MGKLRPWEARRPLNVALNPHASRPTLPLSLEQEELSDLPKVMLTLMTFGRESSAGHRRLLPLPSDHDHPHAAAALRPLLSLWQK